MKPNLPKLPRLLLSSVALAAWIVHYPVTLRAQQPAGAPPDYVEGEILVKFAAHAPGNAIAQVARELNATEAGRFDSIGVRHWRLGQSLTAAQALQRLSAPGLKKWIEYAEPNYIQRTCQPTNDAEFARLWGLYNAGQTGGTPGVDVRAVEAWVAGYTGGSEVVVGVIDSGIDYTHPDLAANIWTNPDEIAGNGVDDDGNGYIDDIRGWDWVNNDNDPIDDHDHGTHVSGTIGGVANNGLGVAGVSWHVKLMPLKFLNRGGFGATSNAVLAMNYAAAKGVRITNNSWGSSSNSKALQDAIRKCGALVVAAAGNNASSSAHYPASYNMDNILAVAATDHNDALASFSNYGSWVDLAAPGVQIFSSLKQGAYGAYSGTSMASPHAAGAAALLLSANRNLTPIELKNAILQNVDGVPALAGKVVTGGRLNVQRALGVPTPTTPYVSLFKTEVTRDNNNNGALDLGENVELTLTLGNLRFAPADAVEVTLSAQDGSGYTSSQAIGTLDRDESIEVVFPFAVAPDGSTGPASFTVDIKVNDVAHRSQAFDLVVGNAPIPADGNFAPIASAGPDQTVFALLPADSATVTLDGSGSSDSDGSLVSHVWSVNGSPIAEGATPSVAFGVETHEVTLTVTDNQGATASASTRVTVISQVFADSMESNNHLWRTEGNTSDPTTKTKPPVAGSANLWHKTNLRGSDPGHSAATSWYYGLESQGNYDTGMRNWGRLISPAMTLPDTGRPVLSVSHLVNVEGGNFDLATIQISTDDGATWNDLLTRGTQATTFTTESVNLNAYLGRTIRIGFFLDTRDRVRNTFEGWYVDDVAVTLWP